MCRHAGRSLLLPGARQQGRRALPRTCPGPGAHSAAARARALLASVAPAGIAAVLLVMLNSLRGMHAKVTQFLQEVTSDDQLGPGGVAVWKGAAKGD
jgi:hypothetical protein